MPTTADYIPAAEITDASAGMIRGAPTLFGGPQTAAPQDAAAALRARIEDVAIEYRALLQAGSYASAAVLRKCARLDFTGEKGSAYRDLGRVMHDGEPSPLSVRDQLLVRLGTMDDLEGHTTDFG